MVFRAEKEDANNNNKKKHTQILKVNEWNVEHQ